MRPYLGTKMITSYLKENPIKVATAIIVFVSTIVSTAFAVDNRYVKETDMAEVKRSIQLNDLNNEKRFLRSQIYTIESKVRKTPEDTAQLNDHKNELQNVNAKIMTLSK
jgi:hypothetical protein